MEIETLEEWALSLAASKLPVIVEGKKDVSSLKELGVEHVFCLNKEPLYKVIEMMASHSKKVVLLTDFDKEGKKLYGVLSSGLSLHGVVVDRFYREWLQKNTEASTIEGLKAT